jgi:hypothetical protein
MTAHFTITDAQAPVDAPKRKSLMAEALKAVEAGQVPPPPVFPLSNYWMQARAAKLHELCLALNLEGLKAYEVTGSNTYSRALRKYQAICIAYLETAPKVPVKKTRKVPNKENP